MSWFAVGWAAAGQEAGAAQSAYDRQHGGVCALLAHNAHFAGSIFVAST